MTDREYHLEALAEVGDSAYATRQLRDSHIRRAHDAGLSLREIAKAVGLTHAGVKKIVERNR